MLRLSRPVVLITLLIYCCYLLTSIDCQSENAIGAHRVYDKTSFSCSGRPSGYYADIETGCQVYHMCDGLGRQFSYSCPNTTLFQQRMLICDHWYMVNCSRAESDYAANLLIGQRDKPFVNDEETGLRTPRPDLLDRPYAPDYSGESFRNQYKQVPAVQNQIKDEHTQKVQNKFNNAGQFSPGQQHWKIPPPSRAILPPAYEAQISDDDDDATSQTANNNVRFLAKSTSVPLPRSTVTTPSRSQSSNRFNTAALHQRGQTNAEQDDLGTSHSTRYNTSADFNSAEQTNIKLPSINYNKNSFKSSFSTTAPSTISTKISTSTRSSTFTTTASTPVITTTTTTPAVKVPSKFYEPPFIYPIYNENTTTASTQTPIRASSATPFTTSSTPFTKFSITTTAVPPPNRPTTLAGRPFTSPFSTSTTTNSPSNLDGRSQNSLIKIDFNQNTKEARTPTPAQGFKVPTTNPPLSQQTRKAVTVVEKVENSPFDYNIPTTNQLLLPTSFTNNTVTRSSDVNTPAKDLLPPFQEYVQHDTATTQGPPIYYEWKVPSNGLEPPKLDPPIGVDGREYPEIAIDYNTISGASDKTDEAAQETQTINRSANENITATRTQISRSIKEATGQPNSVHRINAEKPNTPKTTSPTTTTNTSDTSVPTRPTVSDITQLRKDYSVPEYLFPLEQNSRTGYLSTDSYNSFQLKIPEHVDEKETEDTHKHWFGENPKCPECHPAFVVPGTCEPCIR